MKCDTKNCKNEMMLIYCGRNMCEKCWHKNCEEKNG